MGAPGHHLGLNRLSSLPGGGNQTALCNMVVAQALTRAEVGWLRQHPELLKKVQPIEGLIAPEEIEFAARDWHGACDAFHRHAANRSKEIQRVMRVPRSVRADHGGP